MEIFVGALPHYLPKRNRHLKGGIGIFEKVVDWVNGNLGIMEKNIDWVNENMEKFDRNICWELVRLEMDRSSCFIEASETI